MGESQQSLAFAYELIAQCRREIAAAWEQIEAGRQILAKSEWLWRRWAEQARRMAQPAVPAYAAPPMAGAFEPLEAEPARPRKRRPASRRHARA